MRTWSIGDPPAAVWTSSRREPSSTWLVDRSLSF
jgi:hypothetical protein